MWVVVSNIVIGLYALPCGQCCLLCIWVVCSNIVIGMSFLTCGQCFVFHMWLLGSNIAIIIRTVRTGHVASVVCSVYGLWDLK